MAWLEERGGSFHIGVRVGGRKVKRSLRTDNRKEAEGALARVERRLDLVEKGDLILPGGGDPLTFLLDEKVRTLIAAQRVCSLAEAIDQYLQPALIGSLEANTVRTIRLHLGHMVRVLGAGFAIDQLTFADLQRYVDQRSGEPGKGSRPISSVTIRKELATLSGLWTWGSKTGLVKGGFPNRGLRFTKWNEHPPFQTWGEIERRVALGGLTHAEELELWQCLYLTTEELQEVLDTVREEAAYPFIYPMVLLAAHTGARRSEIARSELADIDLPGNAILLREKKRTRGKRTYRRVPLTPALRAELEPLVKANASRSTFSYEGVPVSVHAATHHLEHTLRNSRWKKLPGWHVFRHTFISICASKGIDQRMIDAWSGHQTEEMRKRYRHLFPNTQQAALASVFGG